jgi:chromosome segregation ATPase
MRRFIEILEAAALIAAIVALTGFVAIEGTVRERLPSILASTQVAAQKFAQASDSLSDAARRQDSYLDQTSRELNKTVADAHDILIHTDASLNGRNGVLLKVNELLAEQQSQLDAIEARAGEALADMDAAEKQAQPILASMSHAAERAAKAAADPRIGESLERLDVAMGEADATLANLQAASASGNRDAQMIEKRLRQALKPASLAKSILLHALGLAGPTAQIASAAR